MYKFQKRFTFSGKLVSNLFAIALEVVAQGHKRVTVKTTFVGSIPTQGDVLLE